jgi:TonB family protein
MPERTLFNDDFKLEPTDASLPFDNPSPVVKAAATARCDCCGGPADDGDLCSVCRHAFEGVLKQVDESPAPAIDLPVAVEPAATVIPHTADVQQTAAIEETPIVEEAAAAPRSEGPAAPTVREPPAVVPVAAASARSSGRLRSLGAAAAAAIVIATIGIPLSKFWLSRQKIMVVEQPAPAVDRAPVPEKPAAKKEPVVAAAPKVEAPPRLPSRTAAPARVAPKPIRPSSVLAQPAVAAPTLAIAGPSAAALPEPEPEAVAPPPPPPPPDAPLGPFFESRDVDRAPQVTSRTEPQIPEGLQDQNRNDILVVRVLVSQSGQPALVTLLRRSKSGSVLDAAVIDAVRRWTFSPAIKRGEAVSCFLNFGVPVGQ